MKFFLKASAALAILGICALARSASAQNLVTNGSFETGPAITSPPGFSVVSSGSGNGPTGWSVGPGTVDYVSSSYWMAADGARSMDLSGNGEAGSISQTLMTQTGQQYMISFQMAGNPIDGPRVKTMRASFGGTSQLFTFDTAGKSTTNMGWTSMSFLATATGTSSILTFASIDTSGYGPTLDLVTAQAVGPNASLTPEASGLVNMAGALLAPGMGLVALRRRKRSA